eukprot:1851302-Rhodomonas_salina.3
MSGRPTCEKRRFAAKRQQPRDHGGESSGLQRREASSSLELRHRTSACSEGSDGGVESGEFADGVCAALDARVEGGRGLRGVCRRGPRASPPLRQPFRQLRPRQPEPAAPTYKMHEPLHRRTHAWFTRRCQASEAGTLVWFREAGLQQLKGGGLGKSVGAHTAKDLEPWRRRCQSP